MSGKGWGRPMSKAPESSSVPRPAGNFTATVGQTVWSICRKYAEVLVWRSQCQRSSAPLLGRPPHAEPPQAASLSGTFDSQPFFSPPVWRVVRSLSSCVAF